MIIITGQVLCHTFLSFCPGYFFNEREIKGRSLKRLIIGTREMVLQLKALDAFTEDPNSTASTHIRWLTTICDSGPDDLMPNSDL